MVPAKPKTKAKTSAKAPAAPRAIKTKAAPDKRASHTAVVPKPAAASSALIGKAAPAFSLADATGTERTLADYKGRWMVLYFYPRDDTPGCTTEACEFTTLWGEFGKLGATVVGVSPDGPERHAKFIEKYKLKVALLSDPKKTMLASYGAYGKKMMYGKEVEGVLRSTVILDPSGRVAEHFRNVKAAGHAQAVAEALIRLRAA